LIEFFIRQTPRPHTILIIKHSLILVIYVTTKKTSERTTLGQKFIHSRPVPPIRKNYFHIDPQNI
jgi:hypothetical protein